MRRAFPVLAATLLGALAVGLAGCGGGDDEGAAPPPPPAATETETTETETETTETETTDGEDAADGAAVFASAGCGGCHTFTPAGSSGSVGPNLDETSLSVEQIEEQVRNGSGAMPAFEGELDGDEISAVAEYVASG